MFKAFAPAVVKEMEEQGTVELVVKPGWESSVGNGSSKPGFISYCIGIEREHIFSCYFSDGGHYLQVTNIKPTSLISSERALVDAYMKVTLKGLIEVAKAIEKKRLIVSSMEPSLVDHMLDLKFKIAPVRLVAKVGARGYKII